MTTYKPPNVGDRYIGDGRPLEWTGAVWAPVCSRCDTPMSGQDAAGWLACRTCGIRATDDRR